MKKPCTYTVVARSHWYNTNDRLYNANPRDENMVPVPFTNRKDAEKWIRHLDSVVYYQSHGEYGRPEYTIRTPSQIKKINLLD
jgi:hypothetical protein